MGGANEHLSVGHRPLRLPPGPTGLPMHTARSAIGSARLACSALPHGAKSVEGLAAYPPEVVGDSSAEDRLEGMWFVSALTTTTEVYVVRFDNLTGELLTSPLPSRAGFGPEKPIRRLCAYLNRAWEGQFVFGAHPASDLPPDPDLTL